MDSISILCKVILAVVYGIVLGIITIPLSKKLASTRTDDPGVLAPLNKAYIKIMAPLIGVGASAAIVFTAKSEGLLVRNLLFLIPIFSLSVVDALVRKIPNPLLLSMLVVEAGYAIYDCVITKSMEIIPNMFVGFMLGMIVCTIPSFLKIPMGAGDIKYSGVIGISLYATGYFQSMIFMALLVLFAYLVLKITKKGGMKTLIPMGPFLSAGAVITMCFSIFEKLDINSVI